MTKLKNYGDIRVFEGDFEDFGHDDCALATSVRLSGISDTQWSVRLQEAGFLFADRTMQATISLTKCAVDTVRLMRLPIIETQDYKDDILAIAVGAFTEDRRFHILEKCDPVVAAKVLTVFVDRLDKVLVCLFKDKPVGFLALQETAPDTLFVHLAAVDEQYRMTGAAMALYARAVEIAKERGYQKLQGRISTKNMPVMNIYASFGAMFAAPQDIFIQEVGK